MENLITYGNADVFLENAHIENKEISNKLNSLAHNKIYKEIGHNKMFNSYCRLFKENIAIDKDKFYNGLLDYCEHYVSNWPEKFGNDLLNEATALSSLVKNKDVIDRMIEMYNATLAVPYGNRLQEDKGRIGLSTDGGKDLSYGQYKYAYKIRDNIKNNLPILCSRTGNSDLIPITLTPNQFITDDNGKVVNVFDSDIVTFSNKLISLVKEQDPHLKWVEKVENKFKLETDMQEAIQAYIIEKYWDSPYTGDNAVEFINDLIDGQFIERFAFGESTANDIKSYLVSEIGKNNKAKSDSWTKSFMSLAKCGIGSTILNIFNGKIGRQLRTTLHKPTVYARGLKSEIDDKVNKFFADGLHFGSGKAIAKDLVNKADILLNFDENASAFFKDIFAAKSREEYCRICDENLSSGRNIGVSLKKSGNNIHVDLLIKITTTSTNVDVFGENAATSIDYYGENNIDNSLTPIRSVVNNEDNLNNIKYEGGQLIANLQDEKVTCNLYIPTKDKSKFKESVGEHIDIAIRSNNQNMGSVTIEAKGTGKAQMGKLVEPLYKITDTKDRPDKNASIEEKIQNFLNMLSQIVRAEDADYQMGLLIASTGYPYVDKSTGESVYLLAPIIKIS